MSQQAVRRKRWPQQCGCISAALSGAGWRTPMHSGRTTPAGAALPKAARSRTLSRPKAAALLGNHSDLNAEASYQVPVFPLDRMMLFGPRCFVRGCRIIK